MILSIYPSIHPFILNQTTKVHTQKHTNHTYTNTNKIKENLHYRKKRKMAWSAPCTLQVQVQLQNTFNKNIVTRWQPVKQNWHYSCVSVLKLGSLSSSNISVTLLYLEYPKKVFQTLIVTPGKPANSTNRIDYTIRQYHKSTHRKNERVWLSQALNIVWTAYTAN